MTFPQGQSFRGFQTAIAVIIQAGRTRSFTCGMGLSGTMHFFGSILVQVPPWEHYKVLSKYHCVLLLWFPSVIPALPLGLGTLEGNWAHYLNSKGYFIKRRTLFQKATSKKKWNVLCNPNTPTLLRLFTQNGLFSPKSRWSRCHCLFTLFLF